MNENLQQFLQRAAEESLDEPGTLGHVLARFAVVERVGSVAEIVDRLRGGVADDDAVVRLCLCRRPAASTLAADAAAIESRFGLAPGSLVRVLRRVDVADAMGGGGASLLAARRDEEGKGIDNEG